MLRFWILVYTICLFFQSQGKALAVTPSASLQPWSDQSHLVLPNKGWLLFPQVLIHPKDLDAERLKSGIPLENYIGLWSNVPDIQPFAQGVATYRLRVHIPGLAGQSVFLRSRDFLRSARIFVNGVELTQVGRVSAQAEDFVPSKAYIFQNFTAPSDDLELVLHVADFAGLSGGIWAPISMYGQTSGVYQMQKDLLVVSGVLVTNLSLSVYFLFLFFTYRQRKSLLYAGLFLLSSAIFNFLTGDIRMMSRLYEFISYAAHTRSEKAFSILSSISILLFLASLFPLDFPRRINRIFTTFYLIMLVLMLGLPLIMAEQVDAILGLSFLFLSAYIFISSVRALSNRRVGSKLWFFGILTFMASMMIDFGKFQALINYPSVSHLGQLVFTLVQAMVVIQQLSKDDRQKRHAYEQLAKVFYPHQLNKMIAGHILEDTMPQGTTEACVLCFDIVSSSTLEHSEARALFGQIFAHCHEALMEGYDQDAMVSNGYRIKEVGDGFYCSVGFPFAPPPGKNPFDLALELALRFVEIFDEITLNQQVKRPLQCSIGIAYDTVEAYFADAGTKSYDIFGRAVILSNRYEDLRRSFFGKEMQVNVIVVQEKVFHQLSPLNQSRLQAFDISDHPFRIRDDVNARRFFYWAEPSRNVFSRNMEVAG